MDFTLPPEIEELRARTRAFIENMCCRSRPTRTIFPITKIFPLPGSRRCATRRAKAGLWAPQSPKEFGGMALPIVAWAAIYEEAARSLFGPLAINCVAPGRRQHECAAQTRHAGAKECWLAPIVEGKVRSSFAMTEPAPGGGSDPAMIRTARKARRQLDHLRPQMVHYWRGRAAHFILIARTSDDERKAHGLSLPPRSTRLAHRAPHRDHGAGGAWRPLRA